MGNEKINLEKEIEKARKNGKKIGWRSLAFLRDLYGNIRDCQDEDGDTERMEIIEKVQRNGSIGGYRI